MAVRFERMRPPNFSIILRIQTNKKSDSLLMLNRLNSGHQKVIKESSHTTLGPTEHCQIKLGQAYVWDLSNLPP